VGIVTHDIDTTSVFDPDVVDDVVQIPDRGAPEEPKRLAAEEGQLVATSASAASLAAQRVAEAISDGTIDTPYDSVVTIFPDSSERYLSKGLYGRYEEWEG
jgi:cysteine synthase A